MRWFTNLKMRTKLTAGFGFLLILLLVTVVAAWMSLRAVHDAERLSTYVTLMQNNLNREQVALFSALLVPAGAEVESRLQEVAECVQENDELAKQAAELSGTDAELKSYLDRLTASRADFRHKFEARTIPLIRQRKTEEATAALLGSEADQFKKFRATEMEFAARLSARSESYVGQAQLIFAVLGGCAILATFGLSTGLSRLIAGPLESITEVAATMAEGDLSVELPDIKRDDEVGLLGQTFRRMSRSLRVLAGRARQISEGDLTAQIKPRSERDVLGNAFANMVTSLRRLMQELSESTQLLASSASEIMASATQLAASAAETATAVTQTTATVEEVKQTSQVSSQKAKVVADEAQEAAEVARRGKAAVDQSIEGMGGIREQMSAVAESILSLSAQGQAIGEIIATVDDLAAQSKLLAVNAAIEAATAGEEGKGFAVVAQEVRSLAEQSRQATLQVRAILDDIQKATTSAVLTTEQGSKLVDAGARQSTSSGESIRALAESVARAAQASTQIAATSQQQFVGMDQVAMAMENIKHASAQTVASTKQAETAAQKLQQLGQKLQELVSRFKV